MVYIYFNIKRDFPLHKHGAIKHIHTVYLISQNRHFLIISVFGYNFKFQNLKFGHLTNMMSCVLNI